METNSDNEDKTNLEMPEWCLESFSTSSDEGAGSLNTIECPQTKVEVFSDNSTGAGAGGGGGGDNL